MAKAKAAKTAQQRAILEALEKGGDVKSELKAAIDVEEAPEGPRTYMGLPGTTLIGVGKFPQTIEDPELQKKIENSRSFKQGHIWLDTKTDEERKAVEMALEGFSFSQLRKLAVALGHRDISRLTKLELIDVCTKDGASLL
jgi:hypothetical protein